MYALERTMDAFERLGIRKTRGYDLIKNGLFPEPISRFERPSRVPKHEVDEVLAASIAGYSDEEIKLLVLQMRERRYTGKIRKPMSNSANTEVAL